MLDLKNFSDASSQTLSDVLQKTNGLGLFIPIYQRPYSWGKDELSKLFYDTMSGFKNLVETDTPNLSATFLGSIITIQDLKKSVLNPSDIQDAPSTVMVVIDGQQRLTSLLILLCVLYEKILVEKCRLINEYEFNPESNIDQQDIEWLKEFNEEIRKNLEESLYHFNRYASGDYQWYPRMIRAVEDRWKKNNATYKSPIASLLFNYRKESIKFENSIDTVLQDTEHKISSEIKSALKKGYFYDIKQKSETSNKLDSVSQAVSIIRKKIDLMFSEDVNDDDLELPSYFEIEDSNIVNKIDPTKEYPKSVKKVLIDGKERVFCNHIRLVAFASFVLNRICLTVITTTKEDYAFDIFESLNTTGTPLTAYETFKPAVIESVGMSEYSNSQEKIYLDKIDKYLDKEKTEAKDKNTKNLIISFANCYDGKKLSKQVKNQRNYLKKFSSILKEQQQKLDFVKVLSDTATFFDKFWKEDAEYSILSKGDDSDIASLCLKFLYKTDTTIAIPLLTRFFQKIDLENITKESVNCFTDALKAVVAFFVFYRCSRADTDGIDEIFRSLMEKQFCFTKCSVQDLSEGTLKQAFIDILNNKGITDKETWKNKSVCIPLYSVNKALTKFVLLAAEDQTVIDSNDKMLRVRGRKEVNCFLSLKAWDSAPCQTIEHIAPQDNTNWLTSGTDVYEKDRNDNNSIDFIGNLTLLPRGENASLSNKGWKDKKNIYKFLAAKTVDEMEQLILCIPEEDKSELKKLRDKTDKYLQFAEAISNCGDSVWTKALIQKRGERILELAWDSLHSWLYN